MDKKSEWHRTMNTPANRWTPHWATHPGQHLLECIEAHGLSVEEFARSAEVPAATIDAIIAGRRPITHAIALRFEQSLGIMPELWFVLQARWQRHQVTFQAPAERLTAVDGRHQCHA
ncbi:addiction module antidote protein, HigA family [Phyllobacterium brassicacearum]|uniref:Addiction module antidote protein, HigA family n=1 Tax=Phyllobacterium brassicacearum TaxID=314235 RepID=A0A2P7BNL6_9HYPH|nr:HigA family addiction module antitoxin [Phyllobacterium brassicacearum]PSH68043.1 addiction module antidote protein, HigA family [Phyllobacterium brassicacearum]